MVFMTKVEKKFSNDVELSESKNHVSNFSTQTIIHLHKIKYIGQK